MSESLTNDLGPRLRRIAEAGLYRRPPVLSGPQGPVRGGTNGTKLLTFCSNDYLGLAAHPAVIAAARRALGDWGVGSGAAHLVCGHTQAHADLEAELAEFTGRERALLFSTGYMANQAVISALLDRHDLVYSDRLNHASLIDAVAISRARARRYPHLDMDRLGQLLVAGADRRRLVVTDAVFSMDGDLAPLPALAKLCGERDAWLMADDAHGFGVLGSKGAGSAEHWGLDQQALPILMCTLGKALGTFGAFVAGSEPLIELLVQRARTYIYTTALPPALAVATSAALGVLGAEPWRRLKLNALIERFRVGARQLGLPLMASTTAIQPLLLGDTTRARRWAEALEARGILVTAIRPPTVPVGTARLRVTLSASHDDAQVDLLLDCLDKIATLESAPSKVPD